MPSNTCHTIKDYDIFLHFVTIILQGDVMNNVYRRAAERDNHQVISTIDFIVNYEEVLNKKSQKATFSGGILKGKTIRTANGGLGPGFKDKYLVKDDGQVEYTLSTHKNSQIDVGLIRNKAQYFFRHSSRKLNSLSTLKIRFLYFSPGWEFLTF